MSRPSQSPQNLNQKIAALSPAQRQLLAQRLQVQGVQIPNLAQIPPRSPDVECPLSFAQERLWFIQQLDPDRITYNVPCALRIQGGLAIAALQQALNQLVDRHETLRTSFCHNAENQPIQVIHPSQPVCLEQLDFCSIADCETHLQSHIQAMADQPVDLATAIVKWQLIQLADDDYVLLILTHHIICDRWSVNIFLRDLATLYAAAKYQLPDPLSSLPIQYADWAIWQRQMLQGETLQQQANYWQSQLAGELPVLSLPRHYDPNQPPAGQVKIQLPEALSQQLRELAGQQNVTLFMLLLATFQVLLHYYTSQEDLVIGSDIINRDRQETEGLIGLLVNTLVLRTDLSGSPTFIDLLQRVREVTLQGYAHQQFPFEKLVEMLNPTRDLQQHMPLFQVKFDLQLAKVDSPELAGLKLTRLPIVDHSPKYDLRLNLQDRESAISGQFEYDATQFSEATIARMTAHWQTLLTEIVQNPQKSIAEYDILTVAEQTQFDRWNQTERDYPATTLLELFEAQVKRSPSISALVVGQEVLDYQTLNARANQLAHYLQALNLINDRRPVGILLDRQASLIIAMLAVLKAGAAYVPLDPSYPLERLQFLVEDAGIGALISDRDYAQDFTTVSLVHFSLVHLSQQKEAIAQQDSQNLSVSITGDDLAYLIYTSGSTGKPKGVAITHRSPAVLAQWAAETFDPAVWQGVLASTSVCFDLSIFEIFVPLCCGGCVILAENALALPELVPQLPAGQAVRLINTVPSAIRILLEQQAIPETVQVINLAGEALSASLVQQLYQLPQIQTVYNLYGPSEDTTYSTYTAIVREADCITLGRPIANTQACILNQSQKPLPVSVMGELYLSGAGLAQGYWQQTALTNERFIQHQGQRWYRTGDQARFLGNGEIEYLGRSDDQVKLRGYRIELGEIATCLEQHPQIRQAIVAINQAASDQLVAYYLGEAIPASELQAYLSDRLPSYMVPNLFLQLAAFPLTVNGKIDRRTLSQTIVHKPQSSGYRLPKNLIEQRIAEIWQQELQIDRVSIDDNFFVLGGHSLLGMRIIAQISDAVGQLIPLKYLFHFPTIAQLAAQLSQEFPTLQDALTVGKSFQPLPLITPAIEHRYQPFPLTDIQQAYLIGRDGAFELGNISTHAYREIETTGLSIAQVETALNALIQRHDMLRMQITSSGEQQILAKVPPYEIPIVDLRDCPVSKQTIVLQEWRDRLSHQILNVNQYPLFYVQAIQLTHDHVRFCIGFDILLGDAWSFQLLGQDFLAALKQTVLAPLTLSFRDYVLATYNKQDTTQYQQAITYWRDRLPNLPSAPELPLSKPLTAVTQPQFNRHSGKLAAADWTALKARAAEVQVTPSSLVLAIFAEVLRRWSSQSDFTLNLTLFNRSPLHPEINQIVGDFTASSLLAIHDRGTFHERLQQIQTQLWQDLEHRAVSGVEVLRMLAQQRQQPTAALMPIVFTSTLTQAIAPLPSDLDWQSEIVYSISQTSQVYLDHQVAEINGELHYNWDVIEELFPAELITDMFSAYGRLLQQFACHPETWENPQAMLLSESVQQALQVYNQTQFDFDHTLRLPDLFFQQVDRTPTHVAIIASEQELTYQLTYQQLADRTLRLAQEMLNQNIAPQTPVLIAMSKGWEQIVAVLAVLAIGAIYVPVDPELPAARIQQIADSAKANLVLAQSIWAKSLNDWGQLSAIAVDQISGNPEIKYPSLQSRSTATDLAYIIYTSGSTGVPKGVMIDHRGAVNTILDMNRRWQITASDRVLALSSLSFDLSVYDIFGLLAVGGAIVLPDAQKLKQVSHWQELVKTHQVTLWNSVPAIFQIYADHAPLPDSLRMVWLSGDWVPPQLVQRLQRERPELTLVSLGGATEASIWSIFHATAPSIDPTWTTIPYGTPLANQQIYVLDATGNLCPPWVMGEIYIAGLGVAQGYWADPSQTEVAFSTASLPNHNRLYRTGDLGRYRYFDSEKQHLTVEFMGRADFQVKLNGYRVELAEISGALENHPEIQQAIVQVVGQDNQQQLVAYLKLQSSLSQRFSRLDPLGAIEFKQQQHHLYYPQADQKRVALPETPGTDSPRRSHRQFSSQAVAFEQLTALLSALRSHTSESSQQYQYPSAGSLYPVQTYVYIKPDRVDGELAGLYYYHPHHHELIQVSQNSAWPGAVYGINQPIFEQAAFGIFLIAQMAAIEPIYGQRSRDFCLLEAGYIGQLLMQQAATCDLGLCPIGDLDFAEIAADFQLSDQQQLLHSFVGGVVNPQPVVVTANPQQQKLMWLQTKLKEGLRKQLPSYMVPQHFILLDEIPLSANGKVDLTALPLPQFATSDRPFIAPKTQPEQALATIWQTTLRLEEAISIDDNFFDRGGNSLSMMQIISQIQQQFQIEMPIATFFNQLTIREQAVWLATQLRLQTSSPPGEDVLNLAVTDIDALSEAELDALLGQLGTEVES